MLHSKMPLRAASIALLLCILFKWTQVDALNIFKFESFSVYSKVNVLLNNENPFFVKVHERYSSDQMRAVITFKPQDRFKKIDATRPKTFYLDRKFNTSVLYDENDLSCHEMDAKELTKMLYIDRFVDDYDNNDLVVGPYRLALFLYQFQSSFKLYTTTIVENLNSIIYDFEYNFKEFGSVAFRMYYPATMKTLDENSMPTKIRLYRDKTVYLASVDYSMYQFDGESDILVDIPKSFNDFAKLDPFITKTMAKCSATLARKSVDLFAFGSSSTRTQFSFRAKIRYAGLDETDLFVVHDSRIGAMRINSLDGHWDISKLISFRSNRVYYTVKPKEQSTESKRPYPACIVAKILPDQYVKPEALIDNGQLIVGSNELIYMGKAEVRGVQVSVYEAHNSSMPFWVDQPIVYQDTKTGSPEIHRPDIGPRRTGKKHQTLVYVFESGQESGKTLKPVMIEVLKLTDDLTAAYNKYTMFLYDFSWTLSTQAPDGMQLLDYFSLKDLCSTGRDLHGEVEMVLHEESTRRPDGSPENAEFNVAAMRNLELMSDIQERLRLPSTMVYDLESKMVTAKSSSTGELNREMLVTFRVAEHKADMANLKYLGRGRLGQSRELRSTSFIECFLASTRLGRSNQTFFTFDVDRKLCQTGRTFDMDEADSELFQIDHIIDSNRWDGSEWLLKMSHGQDVHKFQGEKFSFIGKGDQPDALQFSLERLKVKPIDHDYATISSQHNGPEALVNKISGLGLSELDPQTRVILPKNLNTNNWKPIENSPIGMETEMDFTQCQNTCLRDLDCKSFSICIYHSRVQCVLSHVKFNTAHLSDKISHSGDSLIRQGDILTVTLGANQTIKLVKKSNCAIYNKLFLDLFKIPVSSPQILWYRKTRAVESREQCAEICFKQTMSVLNEDSSESSRNIPFLSSKLNLENTTEVEAQLETHQSNSRKVCKHFFYLSYNELLQLPKDSQKELTDMLINDESGLGEDKIGGYCLMSNYSYFKDNQAAMKRTTYLPFEKYAFKFDYLYEKKYGVYLAASPKTIEEAIAYSEMTLWSKSIKDSSIIALRSFVEGGNNFQEIIHGDETKCAMVCFLQSWGPWPMCRSFDIRIVKQGDKSVVECLLNSISLRQAIETERFDLIEEVSDGEQVWHFDPYPGFVTQDLVNDNRWQMIKLDWLLKLHANLNTTRIHPIILVLIIKLAIGFGLFIGVKLGEQILRQSRAKEKMANDRENLVIEFDNQVNSEMIIPEME